MAAVVHTCHRMTTASVNQTRSSVHVQLYDDLSHNNDERCMLDYHDLTNEVILPMSYKRCNIQTMTQCAPSACVSSFMKHCKASRFIKKPQQTVTQRPYGAQKCARLFISEIFLLEVLSYSWIHRSWFLVIKSKYVTLLYTAVSERRRCRLSKQQESRVCSDCSSAAATSHNAPSKLLPTPSSVISFCVKSVIFQLSRCWTTWHKGWLGLYGSRQRGEEAGW